VNEKVREMEKEKKDVEGVVEELMEKVKGEVVSGYKLSKLVNEGIRELGVGKDIPSQMIYNYIKNGMIRVKVNEEGKKVIEKKEVERWMKKYLKRKVSRKDEES